MLMTAWCGDSARAPEDLDFIAVDETRPVDALDPYPFVELEFVQQWPEVADGAGRYEMWRDEEFATGGQKPRVPPEGLQWVTDEDWLPSVPYGDLVDRVRREPDAGGGVRLDADQIEECNGWTYAYSTMAGVRLVIPWRADGLEGRVQVDFAQDETLPQAPRWTRIPRSDGGQSVVLAASPELSLAWKLMWLVGDTRQAGVSRGKDLYDAVLLAELPGVAPMGTLTRDALDAVRVDWAAFSARYPQVRGTSEVWKRRLASALGVA
ncbi:MAG: nucleotidyl transferase AbiEii/AbiGii toxin family protein [Catenulispora sp.]|nr:nucleotidyl transferase AbiEii/AbiGii toxin family protein [Catenulispora sp.]